MRDQLKGPGKKLEENRPEIKDTSVRPSFDLPPVIGSRGVLIADAGGRITFSDSNVRALLGLPNDGLLGMDLAETVRAALTERARDKEELEHEIALAVTHPDEVIEDVFELADDSRVLHRYSAPLFDGDGNCAGRVEVYSDITRRRELESAIRHAYEELKATQDQLVQSEKLRAVGEIASGVAHDFNNMLGIILGNIQMVVRTASDEKTLRRLQAAERAALDGAETVRRIQEFTRLSLQDQPSVLDLSALASEVAEMLAPAWQSSTQTGGGINLSMDLEDRVLALGIAPEIREVLANVMLNAIQSMPRGGTISVSTGRSGSSGWARMADTGIGMDEDIRRRVFDPFFTTRGPQGTGLGMSVAYGIIRRHDGRISLESEPGKGTVVTVFLPGADASGVRADSRRPADRAAVRPARILVVDDEEMFARVFTEMLAECGHAACVARSGPEALEQFQQGSFDLVFTDLAMPDMSGWQVAKGIKSIRPDTPVVLMTGWGSKPEGHVPSESGVDIVLAKPVRMDELSAVVSRALGEVEE